MSAFHRIKSFLKHWIEKLNEHSLHSPHIYNLYCQVISSKSKIKNDKNIEKERTLIYNELTSSISANEKSLPKTAGFHRKKKYNLLLDRLIDFYNYKNILILGDSFLITTLYLSRKSNLKISLLKDNEICIPLKKYWIKKMKRKNIKIIHGNIKKYLSTIAQDLRNIDLILYDINTFNQITKSDFNIFLPYFHEHSCIIFSGIHNDNTTEKKWKKLISYKDITLSIDLFDIGMVFLNPNINKKNFILSS